MDILIDPISQHVKVVSVWPPFPSWCRESLAVVPRVRLPASIDLPLTDAECWLCEGEGHPYKGQPVVILGTTKVSYREDKGVVRDVAVPRECYDADTAMELTRRWRRGQRELEIKQKPVEAMDRLEAEFQAKLDDLQAVRAKK